MIENEDAKILPNFVAVVFARTLNTLNNDLRKYKQT